MLLLQRGPKLDHLFSYLHIIMGLANRSFFARQLTLGSNILGFFLHLFFNPWNANIVTFQ